MPTNGQETQPARKTEACGDGPAPETPLVCNESAILCNQGAFEQVRCVTRALLRHLIYELLNIWPGPDAPLRGPAPSCPGNTYRRRKGSSSEPEHEARCIESYPGKPCLSGIRYIPGNDRRGGQEAVSAQAGHGRASAGQTDSGVGDVTLSAMPARREGGLPVPSAQPAEGRL